MDAAALAEEVGGAVAFLRGRPRRDSAAARDRGRERRRLDRAARRGGARAPPAAGRRRALPRAARALGALKAERRYHPRNVLFVSDQREQATVEPLTRGANGSRSVGVGDDRPWRRVLGSEAYRVVVLERLEQHLG